MAEMATRLDIPQTRFVFDTAPSDFSAARAAINGMYLAPEDKVLEMLLTKAELPAESLARVRAKARTLVEAVRAKGANRSGVEAFLHQYDLSSEEGVVLMCLAEALIRIPDGETADKLIRDKLSRGQWEEKLGSSASLFVNASTWGLMLTGRLVRLDDSIEDQPAPFLRRMVARAGEPLIRAALRQAMRILGHQFVMGRNIRDALNRSNDKANRVYRYSFDMLGEAALTERDAKAYQHAYSEAIRQIGRDRDTDQDIFDAHSISVKLSALYPRYEYAQAKGAIAALVPRLRDLVLLAKAEGIGLTVDAEEAARLDLSLEIFEEVYRDVGLANYRGLGLAVQAYQKRALPVLDWLVSLAEQVGRRIPVRLVKGAYWDTEIKSAQVEGLSGYPVFTRKHNTDVSYLACAKRMVEAGNAIYPQFATHNAYTLAAILELAGSRNDFEFQRLHGMGQELYDEVLGGGSRELHCRVYAPVGAHKELLPYLVRRLLENGANTSFVNRISDSRVPVEEIIADPVKQVRENTPKSHPRIPLPAHLFAPERPNSQGINQTDTAALRALAMKMEAALTKDWQAQPIVGGQTMVGVRRPVYDPADNRRQVGEVTDATPESVKKAVELAAKAQVAWDRTKAEDRANILNRAADLLEARMPEFMAMCVREAGKSIPDSIAEVREAVDHLRYNAAQCLRHFAQPIRLPGPTGERNELYLGGRGVFVCISPWNFPVAIFLSQISAALAAGNTVLAKPAEQTSMIGVACVKLLHEAGVPAEVLHALPGDGPTVGQSALADPRVAGVAFTGSTETARLINRTLAERSGPIATFIAETGGQNAMIVDNSALAEQVVPDIVQSSFHSAGQRCSALRVLYLQEEIAPRVLEVLSGFMDTLRVGDPGLLSTDVGPVIDSEALKNLQGHEKWLNAQNHRLVKQAKLGEECRYGTFLAPLAVEIEDIRQLKGEVFGPVLHVARFRGRRINDVISAINSTGFGLTFGVHSRIDSEAERLARAIRAGNCYVNRNMVGAVVGVQPFGGQGLSGTGPKAGGPHYLLRYATEKVLTVNTAAVGGNASLLALGA